MKHKISQDRTKLTIEIDEQERQKLRDWPEEHAGLANENFQSDMAMQDFMEPLTCNSELGWIRPEETGDLTDAPMLGVYSSPGMRVIERWAFMDYQVRSPLEDLRDKGEAVFIGGPLAMPKMSNEDFSTYLHSIVGQMSAGQILSYGNVYTELAEALNNEVIEAWEKDNAKRGAL